MFPADLCSTTQISLLLQEWNSVFGWYTGSVPSLSACLKNETKVPHLAKEPRQVFLDFSFIPRPMNIFLKKLQVDEVVRAET